MRVPAASAGLVVVGAWLAGCSSAGTPASSTTPSVTSPRPVRTIIRTAYELRPGQSVRLDAQRGVALRLGASMPTVSRTQLSSSHGYPPAHGYYVTFRITVVNVGRMPIGISPTDFATIVRGQGRVSSYDGNSPYSGAARQLDPTELAPGESVSAPLTFDVSKPHGRLGYYPDRQPAVIWVY